MSILCFNTRNTDIIKVSTGKLMLPKKQAIGIAFSIMISKKLPKRVIKIKSVHFISIVIKSHAKNPK